MKLYNVVQKRTGRALWDLLLFALMTLALVGCALFPPSQLQSNRAKNIILFIGDGMGVSTVTAARIFDGQSQGMRGEEHVLPL